MLVSYHYYPLNSTKNPFNSGTETFDNIAIGETLILDYVIGVSDGINTTNKTVSITIRGTNDAITITSINDDTDSGSSYNNSDSPITNNKIVSDSSKDMTTRYEESGSFTYSNLDLSDTIAVTYAIKSVSYVQREAIVELTPSQLSSLGSGFSASLSPSTNSVTWIYTTTQSSIAFLGAGDTVTAVMTITVDDGAGSTASHDVTISIVGKNSAPIISETSSGSSTVTLTESNVAFDTHISNVLHIADANLYDLVTGKVVSGTYQVDSGSVIAMSDEQLSWLSFENAQLLSRVQTTADLAMVFNTGSEIFNNLDSSQSVTLRYSIRASDDVPGNSLSSNDQVLTIVIHGTNDAPIVVADSALTDEAHPITVDVLANDIDPDTSDTASVFTLTSPSISSITGSDPANTTVNTTQSVSIQDNNLVYAPGDTFNYLAAGESATVYVGYTLQDNEGLASAANLHALTITVNGVNDTPSITKASGDSDSTTKTADNGVYTARGTLTVSDADTSNIVTPSVTSVDISGSTGSHTNDYYLEMMRVNASSVIDTQSTSGRINWVFDSGSDVFDYIAADATLVLTYTIKAQDNSGIANSDSTTHTVTITIAGINNNPIANLDGASVAENGIYTINVLANDTDVDSDPLTLDVIDTVTITHTANYNAANVQTTTTAQIVNNKLVLNLGDEFDYLAVNESATAEIHYSMSDNHGVQSRSTVSVTISGTNDPLALTVNGIAGTIIEGATLTDRGSITFSDFDVTDRPTATAAPTSITALRSDGVTLLALTASQRQAIEAAFSISPASQNTNNGTINWSHAISESDLNFLAKDEVVTAVFTITVSDGHGSTASQDVTVTISGTNDALVVSDAGITGGVAETPCDPAAGIDLHKTGVITFTDLDLTDVHSISSISPSQGSLGTLTAAVVNDTTGSGVNGQLAWDYTVPASAIVYLEKDQTKTETFTFSVLDGQGGSVERTVTITLTGTANLINNLDRDGIAPNIEEYLATVSASSGNGGSIGDLNNDGIQDAVQNAVVTLAWISADNYQSALAGTLTDVKPIISVQAVDASGMVRDTSYQLANVVVVSKNDTSVGGTGTASGVPLTTSDGQTIKVQWDPIQFTVIPTATSEALTDTDPNRDGTQIVVTIDISRSGATELDFNAYLKYVSEETLTGAAAQGITLKDLDGKPITQSGWYDFTQRKDATGYYIGDGARFIVTNGKITAIRLTLTDNAFGDNDMAVGRVFDPGMPVHYDPPNVFMQRGNLHGDSRGSTGMDRVFNYEGFLRAADHIRDTDRLGMTLTMSAMEETSKHQINYGQALCADTHHNEDQLRTIKTRIICDTDSKRTEPTSYQAVETTQNNDHSIADSQSHQHKSERSSTSTSRTKTTEKNYAMRDISKSLQRRMASKIPFSTQLRSELVDGLTPLEDALLRLNSKRRAPEASEPPNSPSPLEKALLNIWLGKN